MCVQLNNAVVSTNTKVVALLVVVLLALLALLDPDEFDPRVLLALLALLALLDPDEFDPLPDASRPFAQSLLVARPSSTLMISRGSCVQSVRFVKHTHTHRKRDKARDTHRSLVPLTLAVRGSPISPIQGPGSTSAFTTQISWGPVCVCARREGGREAEHRALSLGFRQK